jgi:NAD(P)-dependent dehydrogenase (short-subunit alcohol dehydrogenase family)
MARSISEMVVLITGASAGLGRGLAVALHRRGAKLVLAARRIDALHALNRELGGGHLAVKCDVSVPVECHAMVDAAFDHFGRIDTLVLNAGYGLIRTVAETTADDFRRIFETNVLGTVEPIRHALPRLRGQPLRDGHRAQLMIVTSAAARRGLPYFGAYSATKAAQLSIAEALRVELEEDRIAVTSVHPMGTDTDFFSAAESRSGATIPPSMGRHTTESVVRAMAKAIERPRREVWPVPLSNVLLAFGALFPGVGDRVMSKERREIEGHLWRRKSV